MRTVILSFTGIALGVIIAISSPHVTIVREQHANPFYEHFILPSVVSPGKITEVSDNYIIASFGEHLAQQKIALTPYTKVSNGADTQRIEELMDTVALIKYVEIQSGFFAIEIAALTLLQ